MLSRLFLLFTLVPLVELALLIRIGEWLGVGPTVGLVVGTGVVGAWLARREGARTWTAVRSRLESGRMPGEELAHAFLVVVAGAFLVTPGVLTDAAGLAMLVGPLRARVIGALRSRFEDRVRSGQVRVGFGRWPGPGGSGTSADGAGGHVEEETGWHRRTEPSDADRPQEGSDQQDGRVVEL